MSILEAMELNSIVTISLVVVALNIGFALGLFWAGRRE